MRYAWSYCEIQTVVKQWVDCQGWLCLVRYAFMPLVAIPKAGKGCVLGARNQEPWSYISRYFIDIWNMAHPALTPHTPGPSPATWTRLRCSCHAHIEPIYGGSTCSCLTMATASHQYWGNNSFSKIEWTHSYRVSGQACDSQESRQEKLPYNLNCT